MEFCLNPPADWVGPIIKSRFKCVGGRKRLESDEYVVNSDWRTFSYTLPKQELKLENEATRDHSSRPYHMAQGSMAQVLLSAVSSFNTRWMKGLQRITCIRLDLLGIDPCYLPRLLEIGRNAIHSAGVAIDTATIHSGYLQAVCT